MDQPQCQHLVFLRLFHVLIGSRFIMHIEFIFSSTFIFVALHAVLSLIWRLYVIQYGGDRRECFISLPHTLSLSVSLIWHSIIRYQPIILATFACHNKHSISSSSNTLKIVSTYDFPPRQDLTQFSTMIFMTPSQLRKLMLNLSVTQIICLHFSIRFSIGPRNKFPIIRFNENWIINIIRRKIVQKLQLPVG